MPAKKRSHIKRSNMFEPLEDRILLSATLFANNDRYDVDEDSELRVGQTNILATIHTGFNEADHDNASQKTLDDDYFFGVGSDTDVGEQARVHRFGLPTNFLVDNASELSTWIGRDSVSGPSGTFVFERTIDLTGLDTSTARLSGLRYAVDNDLLGIQLNGQTILLNGGGSLGSFTNIGDIGHGLFVSGINTLRVIVDDQGAAMGLRLEGYVVADADPFALAGIVANDEDADGDPLHAVLLEGPRHGTLLFHANGSFTYTPDQDFYGIDSFKYKASDGTFESTNAVVTFNVEPEAGSNLRPVANVDGYVVSTNSQLNVSAAGVLANDFDSQSATLTAERVADVEHGVLLFNADGSFTYTPDQDYEGYDQFTYKNSDGTHESNVATVHLVVDAAGGNIAPIAVDDGYVTGEEQSLTVQASGVLNNDVVLEGTAKFAVLVSDVQNGILSLQDDGSFTYLPNDGFTGIDSFTYRVLPGGQVSDAATVRITVQSNAFVPDGRNDYYAVDQATSLVRDGLQPLTEHDLFKPGNIVGASTNFSGSTTSKLFVYDEFGAISVVDFTDDTDEMHDLVVDERGKVHFWDNVFNTRLGTYDPVTGDITYRTIAGWSTANVLGYGGITAYQNFVYGTDMNTAGASQIGIVRFDVVNGGAERFLTNGSFIDVSMGLDGMLYALHGNGVGSAGQTINVIDPITMVISHSLNLAQIRAMAVDFNGHVFVAGGQFDTMIAEYDQDGNKLNELDLGFGGLIDVDIDPSGRITVASHGGPVFVTDRTLSSFTRAEAVEAHQNFASIVPTAFPWHGVLANDFDANHDQLTAQLIDRPEHAVEFQLNADGGFVYTPDPFYTGMDSFSYVTNDGALDSEPVVVEINVLDINVIPVSEDDQYVIDEDQVLRVGPSSIISTINTGLDDTTFTKLPDGTPDDDYYFGPGSISNVGNSATIHHDNLASVYLANDASDLSAWIGLPNFRAAGGTMGFERSVDVTGFDASTARLTGLQFVADGSLTSVDLNGQQISPAVPGAYRPFVPIDDIGLGSFVDGENTVTFNINKASGGMGLRLEGFVAAEAPVSSPAGILSNDSDIDGDTLFAQVVDGPQHGRLFLLPDGSFAYYPDAEFSGTDSFTYRNNDGELESNLSTVTITVNEVNDIPIALDDLFSTDQDTPLSVPPQGVLINDSDAEGSPLLAMLVDGPDHAASFQFNADGSFDYMPVAGFFGEDTFTYTINDGNDDSPPATVTVAVLELEVPPTAAEDFYVIDENQVLRAGPTAIITSINSGFDNNTHTKLPQLAADDNYYFGAGSVKNPGTSATVHRNVTSTYMSDANSSVSAWIGLPDFKDGGGIMEFEQTIDITGFDVASTHLTGMRFAIDGGLISIDLNDSQVSSSVNGSIKNWVAINDLGLGSFQAGVNTLTFDVNKTAGGMGLRMEGFVVADASVDAPAGILDNDSDTNGDELSAAIVTGPQNGHVFLFADGSFAYHPDANFSGVDTFTYRANDGGLDSAPTTVSITVNQINDVPIANDDQFDTDQDVTLNVSAPGVIANDFDAEGATLIATLLDGPDQASSFTFNSDGSFSYMPTQGFFGQDSFTYQVNDGSADSQAATVTLDVIELNLAPVANEDAYVVEENGVIVAGPSAILGLLHTGFSESLNGKLPENAFDDDYIFGAGSASGAGQQARVHRNNIPGVYLDDDVSDNSTWIGLDGGGNENLTVPGGNYEFERTFDLTGIDTSSVYLTDLQYSVDDSVTSVDLNGQEIISVAQSGAFGPFSSLADAGLGLFTGGVNTLTINVQNGGGPMALRFEGKVVGSAAPDAPAGILDNDTDANGHAMTAQLINTTQNGSLLFNVDGSFTYRPDASFTGIDTFTYMVTDELGEMSAETTVTIHVGNSPPTTIGIDDVSVPVDANDHVIDLFAAFDDFSDTDAELTITIEQVSNGSLFTSTNIAAGMLTLDFASATAGQSDITVRATDTGGAFVETTFSVVVNDAPTTSGIANVDVQEDTVSTSIDLFTAFADAQDADADLVFTVFDNTNPGIFDTLQINPQSGTLTLFYKPDAFGNSNLVIRATDTLGGFADAAFTVTVNPENDEPTTTGIDDVQVLVSAPPTIIDLFARFDDVDDLDTDLVFAIVSNTNQNLFSSTAIDAPSGQLTLAYALGVDGVAELTLRATDALGLFVETSFMVQVDRLAEIHGTIWLDANGDSVHDISESGHSNVEIYLDLNENGVHDSTEPLQMTDANGNYSFINLSEGSYIVAENVPGGFVQTFPGPDGSPVPPFEIDLLFGSGLTASQQTTIAEAAERWSELIVGNLPSVVTDIGVVDDIAINVRGIGIDGAGGAVAGSSPTQLRLGSNLPARAVLEFDLGDIATLEANNQLYDVALHEFAHALGFGHLWATLGLITDAGGSNPRFTGAGALAEFAAITGTAQTSVPVENTGGAGTRDIHWRELIFDNELMTGVLDASGNPISRITLASMADLGYTVDLSATDPYDLPGGGSSGGSGPGDGSDRPLPSTHRVELIFGQIATNVDFGNTELGNVVVPPKIVGLTPTPSDLLQSSTVDIEVTFNTSVVGVDASDMVVTGSAGTNAIVQTPIDLGNNTWRFTVTGLTSGNLDITLAPDADDIEDSNGTDLNPAAWSYTVAIEGPALMTVDVNAGEVHRSIFTRLEYQFDDDVSASLNDTSLTLLNLTTDTTIASSNLSLAYDAATNTATWTFPGLTGGTLPDGNYKISLTGVADSNGNLLDGDGDGTPGGAHELQTFRLFGDGDGDRDVDGLDLFKFRSTFQLGSLHPNFLYTMDNDSDGDVDNLDLFEFRRRFQTQLPPPPQSSGQFVLDDSEPLMDESRPTPSLANRMADEARLMRALAPVYASLVQSSVASQRVAKPTPWLVDMEPIRSWER